MALVNVHPDYLSFEGRPTQREFPAARYSELLAYVKERYAGAFWNVVPRDLARWFSSQISLLLFFAAVHFSHPPGGFCFAVS
jgi:hypothetical protein